MNIRDLRYFLAVVELKHFGKAAEKCFVSQPTLSGQLKKLEEELGVALIERTNRRVIITDYGQKVAASARRILHEVDMIHDVAKYGHDPLSGKFKLAAFPTLANYIFPDLVMQAKQAMPNLRLILIEEKTNIIINQLKNGDIDAALLALPIDDDFLTSYTLFDDEFYLAVPANHLFASYKTIQPHSLANNHFFLLEEGHCLRDHALKICDMHNIAEDQDFKATSIETLRQMVKIGTGITLMPKIAIKGHDEGISYIPFSSPKPMRTIGLVCRKTSGRQAIIDTLIACTHKLNIGC